MLRKLFHGGFEDFINVVLRLHDPVWTAKESKLITVQNERVVLDKIAAGKFINFLITLFLS